MSEEELLRAAVEAHGRPVERPYTFVYFVQAEHGGPIKIGHARDPLKRRRHLQIGSPYPLRITRLIVGETVEEWRLHRLFASIRMSGEWFKAHPALADLADAQADPDLANEALPYDDTLPYDTAGAFTRAHLKQFYSEEWLAATAAEMPLKRWRQQQAFAGSSIPEEPITFRPEPDQGGWRASSA